MNIAETREKCKTLVAKVPRDIFIVVILVLASSFSFGLGYLAGLDAGQGSDAAIEGISPPSSASWQTTAGTVGTVEKVVASKTGTKYYPLGCAGADRILDANKVWFASASVAKSAGYTLATNCKGL